LRAPIAIRKRRSLFECFLYVCPEPVLAKLLNWHRKNGVFLILPRVVHRI
jgi:hypothetical protein